MANISIDNGANFYDANEVREIGRGEAANWKGVYGAYTLKEEFEHLMNVIIDYMDDDVCENVAFTYDCEDVFDFLAEYLTRAECDLVIG